MEMLMRLKKEKLNILGISVDPVTMEEALDVFEELLRTKSVSFIVTPNSEIILNASKDASLARLIASADLIIPDGVGLVYASKLLRKPLRERVTGIDFTEAALRIVAKQGKNVFFLGGKPGIARAAAERKMQEISGLKIVGARDGFFEQKDELEIVDAINAAEVDFLCVALGSPKQEMFIERNRARLNSCVAIGIGGSLDVWSGSLMRAPDVYQKYGLEWLYRLKQEPARLKRMKALPLFLFRVLSQKK
ncbi:MAG: glycosyltransferase [Clostridia bacterium]|nr:glycosyltransferase [Clostridia bacterium]